MVYSTAEREKLKALVAMMGASGSGKTFSSLLLAKGMVKSLYPDLDDKSDEFWRKIGVVDSEHNRSKIYADMEKHGYYIGKFQHANIAPPFEPEKYIEAVQQAKEHGIEVIIVDSTSHAWEWIRMHQQDLGGRYQDWREPDKIYQDFVKTLTQTDIHLIATMRSKQKYALEANEVGKLTVAKLGEQPQQRDTFEYEFLLGLSFDQDHYAHVTKDNTPLFEPLGVFQITPEHGKDLMEWLDKGVDVLAEKRAKEEAELKEKEALIKTVKAYADSKVAGMNEYVNGLIAKAEKTYGDLKKLPIERLQGFANIVHAKEQELKKEHEAVGAEVANELQEHAEDQEIEKMLVKDLREVAKTFNIRGHSSMTKDELIDAIKKAQTELEKQPKVESPL